jgi:hypothetical protein
LGYERIISGNEGSPKCTAIKGYVFNEENEVCSDYYYIPNGYRKIAGNMCEGGISHE